MHDNVFVSRMIANKMGALDGRYARTPCAEEIRARLESFCDETIAVPIKWDGNEVCWSMERLVECARALSENVPNFVTYSEDDVAAINKIFDELDYVREELLQVYKSGKEADYKIGAKLNCISEILVKNAVGAHYDESKPQEYRDGMIFQCYEDLWLVVHRVNCDWVELCARGFSMDVFYDFWSTFNLERRLKREKTEEAKLADFMAILDGTKKFVPVYELKNVGYRVMGSDFEGMIVSQELTIPMKEYRLFQKNEEK